MLYFTLRLKRTYKNSAPKSFKTFATFFKFHGAHLLGLETPPLIAQSLLIVWYRHCTVGLSATAVTTTNCYYFYHRTLVPKQLKIFLTSLIGPLKWTSVDYDVSLSLWLHRIKAIHWWATYATAHTAHDAGLSAYCF